MSQQPRIPVSSLKRNPKQPRKLPERDEDLTPEQRDELIRLGESMRVRQLQPITYLPGGAILTGERRWRAARLVGLKEVWAVEVKEPLTESQERAFSLAENMHRADLSQWEKSVALKEFADLHPDKPLKDLAAMLHLTPASVTHLMSVWKCIPAVQDALKAGRIGTTDAYAISQLPQEDQQQFLDLKLGGASRDELRRQGRKKRTEGKQTARSGSIRVPLSGGTTVTVKGEEMSLEEAIEALGDAVKLAKSALAKGITAKSAQSVWKDLAAAG